MRFPALVFALLALPVLAWAGGASAAPACPFAATAASDGCAGANWSSVSFQRSNFFSYARQSGQTYAGPYPDHPPQYNVAGVDYPVGFYTPTERLVDPSIKAPTNCAYHSSGSHMSGGAYLVCPTSNVGSGQTLTISGLAFGPQNGHDCIELEIDNSQLSSGAIVHIHDNWFNNGADCSANVKSFSDSNVNNTYAGTTPNATFDVAWNKFSGRWYDSCCMTDSAARAVAIQSNGNITFRYNATLNWPYDPVQIAVGPGATARVEFNYAEGFVSRAAQAHGEWNSFNESSQNGANIGSYRVAYNTILTPSANNSNMNTLLWYSRGGGATYVGTNTIDHNVIVANLVGGASIIQGQVSGMVSDATETKAGNVVTILATEQAGATVQGASIFTTGITLFRYLGTDSGGHAQWSFDCGGSGSVCPGTAFAPKLGPKTFGPNYIGAKTGNANLLFQDAYDKVLNITYNYVDPTGTSGVTFDATRATCYGGPAVFWGNVNMLTGAAANAWPSGHSGTGC